ncbi:MAG: hypothetical protein KGS45_11745 [Planctomycetes bacterium]|nr:hypothetical protein [Planctomycetota bacterium]
MATAPVGGKTTLNCEIECVVTIHLHMGSTMILAQYFIYARPPTQLVLRAAFGEK